MLYVPVHRDANQPGNAAIARAGSFRSVFQPRAATRHVSTVFASVPDRRWWPRRRAARGSAAPAAEAEPGAAEGTETHQHLPRDLGSVLVRSGANYTPSLCPGALLDLICLPHRHLSHHGTETVFITAKLQLSHTNIIPGFIQVPYCNEFL